MLPCYIQVRQDRSVTALLVSFKLVPQRSDCQHMQRACLNMGLSMSFTGFELTESVS